MNQEFKVKWVAALRSGSYRQAKGKLRTSEGYCCLGVACDLYDPTGWREQGIQGNFLFVSSSGSKHSAVLSSQIARDLKLSQSIESELVDMNDRGKNFEEIAAYIEANL